VRLPALTFLEKTSSRSLLSKSPIRSMLVIA